MGTTRRRNEDLKSPGESVGSWEGRLPPGGALEEPQGSVTKPTGGRRLKPPPEWGEHLPQFLSLLTPGADSPPLLSRKPF